MTQRVANLGGTPRYAEWQGPALFSQGFRPFFLAAGLSAVVYVVLWVAVLSGDIEVRTAFPAVQWHAHEMIFGVIAAVVTGFLLTAIPNWTGRMPLQGWGLIALFGGSPTVWSMPKRRAWRCPTGSAPVWALP